MYSQLDSSNSQVRLLRLLPGIKSDDVVCELFTVSLDEPNAYEALSYVWGIRMSNLKIMLDGTPKSVTQNLESALRNLRDDGKARTLWIDALCINQDDVEERNSQVQLMNQIYSGAFEVIAWLGPLDGNKDAIDMVKSLGSNPDLHWTQFLKDRGAMILQLWGLLRDEWWTRIWTVQEAVLARRLTYQRGSTCISGQILIDLAESFNEHVNRNRCCSALVDATLYGSVFELYASINSLMDHILRIRQLQLMRRRAKFDEVASLFRNRRATQPLDMVYGLLGISCGIKESSINYNLNKTQAYELATRDCISHNQDLNILSHVIHHNTAEKVEIENCSVLWRKDEPSWVPDWTSGDERPGNDVELVKYRTSFIQHYNACGSLEFQPLRDDVAGKLHVDGVSCDAIEIVSKCVLPRTSFPVRLLVQDWRNILNIEQEPSKAYVGDDTVAEAFWRTLRLDVMVPVGAGDGAIPVRRASADDRVVYYAYWYSRLCATRCIAINDDDLELSQRFNAFKEHTTKAFTRRKFFVSQKGYMGLAPLGTEPGDRICILAGGKAPFIVRAAQEDEGIASDRFTCRLLGDAYVHGLMDGEAMKLVQEGVAKIEGFELI